MATEPLSNVTLPETSPEATNDLTNGTASDVPAIQPSIEPSSTNTVETTINIKEAAPIAPVDANPAVPTPVQAVSEGIQPVADFIPKDAPVNSHPTPPPDQPLGDSEAAVDTEMADAPVETTAAEPIEPSTIIESKPDVAESTNDAMSTLPVESTLVRPRDDDDDGEVERATKRSKLDEDVAVEAAFEVPPPDVPSTEPAVEAAASAEVAAPAAPAPAPVEAEKSASILTAAIKSEEPATEPVAPVEAPVAVETTVEPVAPQSATSTVPTPVSAQPTVGESAVEDVKPSVEVAAPATLPQTAAPAASTPASQQQYPTEPVTKHQKSFLAEKIKNLKKTKSSGFFVKPVDYVGLNIPSYPEIVKQPMDLGTMDAKLKGDQYSSVQAFVDDFYLIINNCRTFNGDAHPVTQAGMSLEAYFRRVMEAVPSADQAPPPKSVKGASPAVKTQPPRRESRTVATATAASPVGGEPFALQPDGTPQIRRDSNMNRPARAIKPPASREVMYAKPKRKEHQMELRFCEYVLDELRSPKYGQTNHVFQVPVDPVALNIPNYRQIVKTPMDLSTMAQKLKQGQYGKAGEFKKDFDLMIQNCLTFNPIGNAVHDLGIQFQREFAALWAGREKWERANKPESTRGNSASADEDSGEEEDEEDDEPEDEKQQTIEALQKQLAEMQSLMAGLVPGAKAPKTKKSSKTKKPKASAAPASAPSRKIVPAKPAKSKKPKQVTYEEKQEISEAVGNMSEAQVSKLTSIITENCSKYRDMEDMELEIDDLPNNVQLLLLDYVRRIFGRPKKAAPPARGDSSDDDIAGLDDDDFQPRGGRGGEGKKRKKHKPMGRHEQNDAIQSLKNKLNQFGQAGTSGSESPTNSSFNAAHNAADSSGDDESEESEEE